MALRAALGATRGTIVRQLMVEGPVLSAAGATGGIVLARADPDTRGGSGNRGGAVRPIRIDAAVHRMRSLLVAGQMALSMVLLIGWIIIWRQHQGVFSDFTGI